MKKALDRTWTWYKTLVEKHATVLQNKALFAVLIWDEHHPQATMFLLDKLLSIGEPFLQGIVLSGFHDTPSTTSTSRNLRVEYIQKIRTVIKTKKPFLLLCTQCADTIPQILTDLSLGVDFIHSTYPLQLTLKGYAINFEEGKTVQTLVEENTATKRAREEEENESQGEQPSKKARTEEHSESEEVVTSSGTSQLPPPKTFKKSKNLTSQQLQQQAKAAEQKELQSHQHPLILPDTFSMNLWNECYRKDTKPLVSHCSLMLCTC
jgi:hypothetical protein